MSLATLSVGAGGSIVASGMMTWFRWPCVLAPLLSHVVRRSCILGRAWGLCASLAAMGVLGFHRCFASRASADYDIAVPRELDLVSVLCCPKMNVHIFGE